MIAFLKNEKGSLGKYAWETWKVLQGKFDLTEMNSLLYKVEIRKEYVSIFTIGSHSAPITLPTIQFKALLEMFR